jgi:hypothetical protein
MGVGRREFQCFLCDGCGREVIAEDGQTVDGYFMEVLRVLGGNQVSEDNVYACSDICVERSIRDSIKRAALPEPQKLTATQELWLRGRAFNTHPGMPILDIQDETRQIGTAHEISRHKPTPVRRLEEGS